MNIKEGFRSIGALDVALLFVGSTLCSFGIAIVGGWEYSQAMSTSIGGLVLAVPMMSIYRARGQGKQG